MLNDPEFIIIPELTDDCSKNKMVLAMPFLKPSDQFYTIPTSLKILKDNLELQRDALIIIMEDEVKIKFEPYDDAMECLKKLSSKPIPDATTSYPECDLIPKHAIL